MGKYEAVATTKKPLQAIPVGITDVIGKPPLLPTENASEYDALLLQLADAVDPQDLVDWIWISDITSLAWEMRRLRNLRDRLLENHLVDCLADVLLDGLYEEDEYEYCKWADARDRLVAHWNSNSASRREVIFRLLRKKGLDLSHVYAAVYQRHLDNFSKLEGLIANLGRRRDSVLREIERRRETIARRLRDVTEAEFKITNIGSRSADK